MSRSNLLPRHIVVRQAAARRKRAWYRFLRWYGCALFAIALAAQFPATAQERTLMPDIERVTRRLENSSRSQTTLTSAISSTRKLIEASRAVGHHPDWSVVLSLVESTRRDEIVLEALNLRTEQIPSAPPSKDPKSKPPTIDSERATITLVGLAEAPAQVLAYTQRIETLALFDRVTLKDTRPHTLGGDSVVRFELELVILSSPGAKK